MMDILSFHSLIVPMLFGRSLHGFWKRPTIFTLGKKRLESSRALCQRIFGDNKRRSKSMPNKAMAEAFTARRDGIPGRANQSYTDRRLLCSVFGQIGACLWEPTPHSSHRWKSFLSFESASTRKRSWRFVLVLFSPLIFFFETKRRNSSKRRMRKTFYLV